MAEILDKAYPKYCASPWVEGVLRMNGRTFVCCKSTYSIGNWQKKPLAQVYNSKESREIREAVTKGEFAPSCETCYKNGGALSLSTLIARPFQEACSVIKTHTDQDVSELARLQANFDKLDYDEEAQENCTAFYKALETSSEWIDHPSSQMDEAARHDYRMACRKLTICADIVVRFLTGETEVKYPAALRQSNVIAVCNARCIMCPGKFTKEITEGYRLNDGTVFTEMPDEMLDKSFENEDSIIDFFVNGSEFLFYKRWRKLAERLLKLGVKARIATNGMLLTPRNTDYLLENKIIGRLSVSIEGATQETLEAIRQRVKYDRLVQNYKYFFKKAAELKYSIPISSGFVLMTDNYRELPQLVDFIHSVREGQDFNTPTITVSALGLKGGSDYRDFVLEHHHTNIDHEELKEKFEEMLVKSEEYGIPVYVFHTYRLRDFVEKGCPVPDNDFNLLPPRKLAMASAE